MSDTKIQQVCGALSRFYEFVRADPPYAQQFSIFCDDNGFDDDSLRQELQDQETVIIEFDPNFPIDDRKQAPEDMDRHILTILNLCAANPERSWDIRIPRFDIAKTYELDLQFMNRFTKKGDPRYIIAGCHTKDEYVHIQPLQNYHARQQEAIHTGKLVDCTVYAGWEHDGQKKTPHTGRSVKYHSGKYRKASVKRVVAGIFSLSASEWYIYAPKDWYWYDCCNEWVGEAGNGHVVTQTLMNAVYMLGQLGHVVVKKNSQEDVKQEKNLDQMDVNICIGHVVEKGVSMKDVMMEE
eukprot:493734_1